MSRLVLYSFLLVISEQVGLHNCQSNEYERNLFAFNGIVDGIIHNLKKVMIQEGYEPLQLPPYEATLFHIGFLGKLRLRDSHLYNITTLHRSEDVQHERVGSLFHVKTTLKFQPITINSTYKLSSFTVKKSGIAVARLPELTAEVNLDLNLSKLQVELDSIKLRHTGLIDVHLEGGVIDGIMSILTETVSNWCKNKILRKVETVVQNKIRDLLRTKPQDRLLLDSIEIIARNKNYIY